VRSASRWDRWLLSLSPTELTAGMGTGPGQSHLCRALTSLLLLFGSEQALANIRVMIPPECPTAQSDTSAESGFADRLGDARFFPTNLRSNPDMQTVVQPRLDGPLVSAAPSGPDTLLIANYRNIQSLNTSTGAVTVLRADFERLGERRYVPTGIAIGPKSGDIYIANYLANNILVGHLAGNTVSFDREIVSDDLISPENIAISADESWIVTANFDGNTATGFVTKTGQLAWATKVPLAHGVAILGHYAFVSSLQLRRIFILDLATGDVVGSFGEPGWNAYCLHFLWPTGLYAVDNKTIVVTDAHTGGIYRLAFDNDTVTLMEVTGGTVPGALGLQMPYATTGTGGDLAVLSTFSPKIVIAGPEGGDNAPRVKKLIVQQHAQAERRQASAIPVPLGVGWNGYLHLAATRLHISGIDMVPSYGALEAVTSKGGVKAERPFALNPETLSLFGSLMYFVQARRIGDGAILSSPSAPYALYVKLGETSCAARIDLPGPPLATDRGLEHRLGVSRYEDIEELAVRRLRDTDARRRSSELLTPAEVGRLLGSGDDVAKVVFSGNWGAEAADQLSKCAREEIDREKCRGLAKDLKAEAQTRNGSSFFLLLMIDGTAHRCLG
jgi:hypothetical protein